MEKVCNEVAMVTRSWKEWTDSPLYLPEGMQPCWHFDFSLIGILLAEAGFWELNTFETESLTLKDKEMGVYLTSFLLPWGKYS